MAYSVKGIHNRHFELFDENGASLGKLDYINWLSTNAEISLAGLDKYRLSHKGILGVTIGIEKAGDTIGEIKFNWKGHIIINLGDSPAYIFRRKGFWRMNFELQNEQGIELATIQPSFEWTKLSHNYEIELSPSYADVLKDPFLLLLFTYCANLAISTGHGG